MILLITFFILSILLYLQGLYAGLETAFLSVNKKVITRKIKKIDPEFLEVIENQELLIGSLLVAINLIIVLSSSYFTYVLKILVKNENLASIISSITLSPLMILFGEIIPKTYFRFFSEEGITKHRVFIKYTYKIFSPLVKILELITRLLLKSNLHNNKVSITKEELQNIIANTTGVEKEEKELLHKILSFSKLQVKDILTPRVDVKMLDANWSKDKILQKLVEYRYSRLPVFKENIDNVIGVANLYKLLELEKFENIEQILETPLFIPEVARVTFLLQEMQKTKTPFAIVIDEYGGMAGIVTDEDIVEELVGDFEGEFEPEENELEKISKDLYLVDASISIEEFEKLTNINLHMENDEELEDIKTIGGFLIYKFGKLPKKNDKIIIDNVTFIIEEANDQKIDKVLVSVKDKANKKILTAKDIIFED